MTTDLDMFDSPANWASDPINAFDAWLSSQKPALSTHKVRMSMWNKFIRYLKKNNISIIQCEAKHLNGFITAAKLEKEQGWRYVKLIERVYDHLSMIGLQIQNPGREAAKNDFQIKKNDPMRFLSLQERKTLKAYILRAIMTAEKEDPVVLKASMGPAEYDALWMALRDEVVTAVIIGGGLKIHELGRLSVNCTSITGELLIKGTKIHPERTALMLPLATRALVVWMKYRATERNLGEPLFPAMISRRRHDQRVISSVMHASTMFRRVHRLLDLLGIKDARTCGQTLRNTYAAELIESGMDDAGIVSAMGYQGDFSIQRLRAEHADFYNHE